jgi:signal transduction histidine kinase
MPRHTEPPLWPPRGSSHRVRVVRTVSLGPVSAKPPSRSGPIGAIPLYRSPVNLVQLARSTLEPLEREARSLDVTLSIDGVASLDSVSVDPEKMAWVIATLAGNALRYVRRGSRRLPGGDIVVRLCCDEPSKTVTISVEDDGPGIPADKLPFLFERQAGSQHSVGLGLTLVNDIVVAHGGNVRVESSTDHHAHGTTVRVTLPTT